MHRGDGETRVQSADMWKAAITVVMATIGILAVVLATTIVLIDAATVDTAAMRDPPQASRCHRGSE